MHDFTHRLAAALLLLVGLATLATALAFAPAAATLAARHEHLLVALTGAALALAPWWPALRTPALSAALLSKLSLLALAAAAPPPWFVYEATGAALLLLAAGLLLREARREARWNLSLRQEG